MKKESVVTDIFNECRQRRARLYAAMGNDSIAILFAACECAHAVGPREHRYRQASDFYYLTAFPESESIAVFIPGREEGAFILFNRPTGLPQEIWTGKCIGQNEACAVYGADQSFPIDFAATLIPKLLKGKQHLYYDFGCECGRSIGDAQIIGWLNSVRSKARCGVSAPDSISYLAKIVHEMRLCKSPYEISLLRRSASIAVDAHLRAMSVCQAGMFEYQLEAELLHEYMCRDGCSPAFLPIIAGGANSCTLHYKKNDQLLNSGDLVLIDAGVDYQCYASDVTRTIPIAENFNREQRLIYQAVLDTQLAIIDRIRPGVRWNELQQISERVITEKLLELGLLSGQLEALLAKGACKRFYMHRFGHWLGMDVHDVGKYVNDDGDWCTLEPGMVLTVEPGIYVAADSIDVAEKWWNIGVRIEDDVLVTMDGCEVLTAALPKTIAALEELRAKACFPPFV